MKYITSFKPVLNLGLIILFASCSKKSADVKPQPTPLTITSLSVSSGPFNTSVVITGTGFNAAMANDNVFFNGKVASISAATSTQLTVTVPLGSGTGNVTVSVNNSTPVSGPLFTYQLSAVVTTLAGSTATGSADGKGSAASFSIAYGIIADASGNLYVSDKNNFLIRKITSDGTVSTLAGSGTSGISDGQGMKASFSEPLNIAFGPDGNLYVTDFVKNLVRKVTPAGLVSTVQPVTNKTGYIPVFFTPQGIAFDAGGNMYVSNLGFGYIEKLDVNSVATIFAGNGQIGLTDGQPPIASFENIKGMRFDKNGNLYVADYSAVRMIDKNNNVTTIAGSKILGNADGKGAAATFNNLTGLAIDNNGNIYVADQHNYVIRKIASDGTVTTIAGNTNTSNSVDGAGANAGFKSLEGICIDSTGTIYVTDENEIRKIVFE